MTNALLKALASFKAPTLFAIIGPPCGVVGFVLATLATASRMSSELLLMLVASSLVMIPVSYILGTVPALATGLVA
jgi:hypothetical protein